MSVLIIHGVIKYIANSDRVCTDDPLTTKIPCPSDILHKPCANFAHQLSRQRSPAMTWSDPRQISLARSCYKSCKSCGNLAVLHVIWPLSSKSCNILLPRISQDYLVLQLNSRWVQNLCFHQPLSLELDISITLQQPSSVIVHSGGNGLILYTLEDSTVMVSLQGLWFKVLMNIKGFGSGVNKHQKWRGQDHCVARLQMSDRQPPSLQREADCLFMWITTLVSLEW